ncbi:MAG: radical SAM protein [Candidatus Rokubacteria bacterium RBG_16_73_20]|nr:MAG: radical SAM protein [Candidatus Rokubacteria bacterium GWA2_70_23]OGK78526.1 MAG: radical SAM protein [Candidatus Rokubacteria bacterium GWC2_70_16]OGK94600.1 MAG: radical SAM protein [Candidatus Rokubacteria bacterium RBG_16_73_20]HBH01299.1 radical SAM protein [Candidatus Rokubacteria bacterium]
MSAALASRASKLRVTLVRGPIVSTARSVNNEATPCIGLAYVSAYARAHGYAPTIVDAIGEGLNCYWAVPAHRGYVCQGLTVEEILARIPRDTDVIGFSAMFSGEWPVQRELIAATRREFPKAVIVAGGEHITALPEYSLHDCPALDVCVRGEGEHTFLELLECLSEGRDLGTVNGIAYLDGDGRFRANDHMPRIRELARIPWPDWPEGYLEKFWAAGKSYGIASERDMPLLVSRGCPYQCTFCSSPQMWTTLYRLRDADDVIAEIEHYRTRYAITSLQLYDLTAITKKSWTVEFANKLTARGIDLKWSLPSGTRSEALDHETLGLLKRTGCSYLVYAPESGSPNTLQMIKKKIQLPRITASILEAKRQGIVVRTNLIIGFPHETRRDVFQTIRYGLMLAARGADEVSINILSPYPGSELTRGLIEAGKVRLGDRYFLQLTSLNSDYTRINPLTLNPVMGPRELALYRIGFMLLNYLIGYVLYPARIWRTIRNVFMSRHAAATVFEHRLKDALRRTARGTR